MQINDIPGDEYPFTPGPWQISWSTFNGNESHGIYAPDEMDLKGHQIAIVNWWPTLSAAANEETGKANARLIAAAPDLLQALQLAFDALVIKDSDIHAAMHAARKALKKAYGND